MKAAGTASKVLMFAAGCWPMAGGCWLVADGSWLLGWAVHESELNQVSKNSHPELWGWSRDASGRCLRDLWGSLGDPWEDLGRHWMCPWADFGSLWGPCVGPWGILGGSLGGPGGPLMVLGVPGAPHGRPQGGPMMSFYGKARAVSRIPGAVNLLKVIYRASSQSIIWGVLALLKLSAKAKSNENERTKAESLGFNTPLAYRPGEL